MRAGWTGAFTTIDHGDVREWAIHRERVNSPLATTWCHRPEPFSGEAFLSYFTRAAKANFSEPNRLVHVLNPKKYGTLNDLDRVQKGDLLQKIAQALNRDERELREMCISRKPNHRIVLDGARFCPFCLAEDGKFPHFRYAWRLNFVTVCTTHGCYLADKCPSCGAPVRYWETRFDQSITECWQCGGSLIASRAQVNYVEPEYQRDPLFKTFQETLLNIYRTEQWNEHAIVREKFIRNYWRLAWAVHRFGIQGNSDSIEDGDTWQSFMKDVAMSPIASFKVLFPAYNAMDKFPERLNAPFVCPIEGRTFSSLIYYMRHAHAHDIFSGKNNLECESNDGGSQKLNSPVVGNNPVLPEIMSTLQKLKLREWYKTYVLADIQDFLEQAPPEFLERVASDKNPSTIATGLTWAFGKFYGITQAMLAAALGRTKYSVFHSVEILKNLACEGGTILPSIPPRTWVDCILNEVHERFYLLSPKELADLAREVWNLDMQWEQSWKQVYFLNHVTKFAEFIYIYWAKGLGRPIPRKVGDYSANPSFADLRGQLAVRVKNTKVECIQTQILECLSRIVDGGGLNSTSWAPLTPTEAFQTFLQERFPRWHSYTFSNLAAVLFLFVRTKNSTFNLSIFSGFLGFHPSRVCRNLKKLGLLARTGIQSKK